ncbi:MAG: DUF6941 family protein [Pirellulales bacterium]
MGKKKSRRKGAVPPPKCKAILICERTIIEAGTGKVSLISLFDSFIVANVPGITTPFTVYLHLTDGVADHEYQITIELHDLSDGTVLAKAGGPKVQWKDRLAKLNLFIPVPALNVQHEGSYDFVVFANGQEIDRQSFAVKAAPTPDIQIEGQGND